MKMEGYNPFLALNKSKNDYFIFLSGIYDYAFCRNLETCREYAFLGGSAQIITILITSGGSSKFITILHSGGIPNLSEY